MTVRRPVNWWPLAAAALAGPLLLGGAVAPAAAQPALDRAREAGSLTVFPDAGVEGRYYYLPGPLELATRDGRPAMLFLLTRYSGSLLTGDQGATGIFAHLSFDIVQNPIRSADVAAARRLLASEGVSRPDIRLLPVRRTEAQVVFAPLAGGRVDTISGGTFENRDAGSGTLGQRRYTLRLDPHTAEALWKMLESERTLVSFSYAYVAAGVLGTGGELHVSGDLGGAGEIDPGLVASAGEAAVRTVRADAFEILLDPGRDTDLIRVVDVNAERALQPAHGVLDIRCYDFRNGLRNDLAMKVVELEAEAANGRTARKQIVFKASHPDEAVYRVRFPYAVRLDRPIRYRVREIATNGEERRSDWQERSWLGVLDVTTPGEQHDDDVAGCRATNRSETEECS